MNFRKYLKSVTHFIKHYNDETIAVNTEITKFGFDLNTWYKGVSKGEDYRNALVIKK